MKIDGVTMRVTRLDMHGNPIHEANVRDYAKEFDLRPIEMLFPADDGKPDIQVNDVVYCEKLGMNPIIAVVRKVDSSVVEAVRFRGGLPDRISLYRTDCEVIGVFDNWLLDW